MPPPWMAYACQYSTLPTSRLMTQGLVRTHAAANWRQLLGLQPDRLSQDLMKSSGLELTRDGRSALYRVLCELVAQGRTQILLPAFHCPSVVTSALAAGMTPRFYRIKRDLTIDAESVRGLTNENTAAVLVIHYFGAAADLRGLAPLFAQGVSLIEDWSHSFLDGAKLALNGRDGAYRIYSFWKLVPSQLGGGLIRPQGRGPAAGNRSKRVPSHRLRNLRLGKTLLEEMAASHGPHWVHRAMVGVDRLRDLSKRWRSHTSHGATTSPGDLREQGEHYYPFDPALADCDMPWVARRIIEHTDLTALADVRRAHFQHYARSLAGCENARPMLREVPAVVPWVFPVIVADRDKKDHLWRARGVPCFTFGPFLHSRLFAEGDAEAIEDARYLSRNLLCLAVHQDLTRDQVADACAVLCATPAHSSGSAS